MAARFTCLYLAHDGIQPIDALFFCVHANSVDGTVGKGYICHGFTKSVILKQSNFELIESLAGQTRKALAIVRIFGAMAPAPLIFRAASGKWSAVECIAHLNRYFEFYGPLLEAALSGAEPQEGPVYFQSGIMGQFFVGIVTPRNGTMKLKAMARMDPATNEGPDEVKIFQEHLEWFLPILMQCRELDLSRPRVRTAMSPLIRISLGDTLRFIVAHNQRHLEQAQDSVSAAGHRAAKDLKITL